MVQRHHDHTMLFPDPASFPGQILVIHHPRRTAAHYRIEHISWNQLSEKIGELGKPCVVGCHKPKTEGER